MIFAYLYLTNKNLAAYNKRNPFFSPPIKALSKIITGFTFGCFLIDF